MEARTGADETNQATARAVVEEIQNGGMEPMSNVGADRFSTTEPYNTVENLDQTQTHSPSNAAKPKDAELLSPRNAQRNVVGQK